LKEQSRFFDEQPAGSITARWLFGFWFSFTTSKGEAMTLKSRLAGLVTILMLFAMAPAVFAQVSITIIPDNQNSADINTNNNALAASPGQVNSGVLVVGSLIATSPLSTTVLRISYPGAITSLPSGATNCTIGGFSTISTTAGSGGAFSCGFPNGVPSNDPIRIVGASGVFASMNLQPLLNTTSQRVEIQLPSSASNSSSGSFRLVGVRLNANGLSGAQTVSASLNNTVNNYLIGSPSTGTVINSLNPGIGNFSIGLAPGNSTIGGVTGNPGAGAATVFTNRNVARSQGAFILVEGCASCWRTISQNGNNDGILVPNSTQIRLTFNNVPAGVTITLPSAVNIGTAASNSSLAATIATTSITTSANTAVINITSTALTQIETMEIDYTVTVTSTASVSTPGSVTANATMFPVSSTPFDTASTGTGPGGITLTGVPTETNGYPTFTDVEAGPITVINIVPANTTLLMPYAVVIGAFDTGLAIANTTADPFGSGNGGATPSNGTITLSFFPTTATGGAGTPFSLTTSSTVKPGVGLSSDGTLAAGATWVVLLSQLLTAAGQTGLYQGYIFIQTNFLLAHATATISDFKTYSLTSNVLVLSPPSTSARGGGTSSAESLGH